jgi:hypothetical protein
VREEEHTECDGRECSSDLHEDEHGTLLGAMLANVLVIVRPMVTAGFAKLVEDVNQYAAVMYPPTANAASPARPDRTTPRITIRPRRCWQREEPLRLSAHQLLSSVERNRAPKRYPTMPLRLWWKQQGGRFLTKQHGSPWLRPSPEERHMNVDLVGDPHEACVFLQGCVRRLAPVRSSEFSRRAGWP